MSKHDATGWYADTFNTWHSDLLGRKPTAGELATIHALGARPGKQALANAMALRPAGVTGAEIVMACGAPQLNKMRGFIGDGVVKRVPVPPRNGHTVYKLELTAAGAAKVKAVQAAPKPVTKAASAPAKAAAPDKPAKPKRASKPRKPAAAPVPVSEPVQVPSEPVQVTVDPPAPQA